MLFSSQLSNQRRSRLGGWLVRLSAGLSAAIAGAVLSALLHTPVVAQTSPQAGGATTIQNRSSQAYTQPAPNLNDFWDERHAAGDLAFEAAFVTPPANVNAGLGPLFNSNSCVSCHINNGRGLPEKGQRIVRVSLLSEEDKTLSLPPNHLYTPEAVAATANTPPVPGLGTQIQEQGVYGYPPEATVEVTWQEQTGRYPDGTAYSLRSPQLRLTRRDGTPLTEAIAASNRIPLPVFGLGLLEAVPEEDIVALADPDDRDGDGISGRPNYVWNVAEQANTLGRFGWKANTPNLLQQSASAYANDMGVTNPLFPDTDGHQDIGEDVVELATIYVQTLAVPKRTALDDPQVQRGEQLFADANCATCHTAQLRTGSHEIPALVNQTFHPYTDLLLHDMGPELADGRPDFQASGREWRTTPLWGIGLAQTVLPYSGYLHDGRARSLEEAILWHGGEAAESKDAFRQMNADDRAALIQFLRSL